MGSGVDAQKTIGEICNILGDSFMYVSDARIESIVSQADILAQSEHMAFEDALKQIAEKATVEI